GDRIARTLEQPLAGGEDRMQVAPSPRIREVVARDLGATGHELLDLSHADGVTGGPRGDLVDLAGQLIGILTDELDEGPARVGLDRHAAIGELPRNPLREATLRQVVEEHLPRLRAR